ncbi:MAG TPA: thiolase family protein [Actinomycetes bacterium]|nr:thiolase family protein [Actinomycetes bacterium]
MKTVYVVDACRTPLGKVGGALRSVRPDDLAGYVISALLRRNPYLAATEVDDVIWGAANQAGEDNRDVARMAVLLAGLPVSVPGVTVNRLCASGMSAVVAGARAIATGEVDVVVVGGGESMTRAPLVSGPSDRGLPDGHVDTRLGWRLVNPRMETSYPVMTLGETAEVVAERYGISRERQDAFAHASHQRAHLAWERGAFAREVVGIGTDAGEVVRDEGIRPHSSLEDLARLKPAFRGGGTVTAGNSSQISDGAAGLVLASEAAVLRWGAEPLARYVTSAAAGVHPEIMGIGPVPATRKVLGAAGWAVSDVDRVELNEAFAAQAVAVIDALDLDPSRVNQQGGAIALGHPLGCSGARLVGTLAHQMQVSGESRGLATLCVGVGQGQSVLLERP